VDIFRVERRTAGATERTSPNSAPRGCRSGRLLGRSDHPGGKPEIADAVAPKKRFVPVVAAIVLVGVPGGLGFPPHVAGTLAAERRRSGDDRGALARERSLRGLSRMKKEIWSPAGRR
jgi:hypothetical protein